MGRDNPDRARNQIDIDDQGAARLDAGQPDLMHVANDAFPKEQEIPVPAAPVGGAR